MRPGKKKLLALGSLLPLPICLGLMIIATAAGFDGRPDGIIQTMLFTLYWAALAAGLMTWVASLFWLRRSDEIASRWVWWLGLGTIFLLPFCWWRVIRPLPETH